jgi:hypothetical protein
MENPLFSQASMSVAAAASSRPASLNHQSPLDLIKKDLREGCDGSGAVCEKAPQSLGHGDHPLPHGHRRDDVIDKMRGRLGHVALAGEGHDEPLAAGRAASTSESEAEEPAPKIAAEFVLNVCRHGSLGSFAPLEPALEVLRHDPVERRLLGPTPLVTACGTASPRGAAGSPGDRSGGS